jgi:hypothetical protein
MESIFSVSILPKNIWCYLIKRVKDKRLSDGPSDFVVDTGNLTWDEYMEIVNANTGLGQTQTLSGEGLKKLNQKLKKASSCKRLDNESRIM